MARLPAEEKDVDIDIAGLVGAVWKRKLTVLLSTVAFAGTAFAIATMIPPTYRADTQIVIESRESAFTRTGGGNGQAESPLSPESVESQVSLMTSSEVLGAVAERFGLATRPEFAQGPSLADRLFTSVEPAAVAAPGVVETKMREKLQVYRKENQRVIVIEFSSEDPQLARDVPNAIADEYLSRQKGALLSSNTNATGWLEEEIDDLRQAVRAAESEVAAFRASSNLLVGQNRDVLATQQLSEISSELSRTRAARAAAEGRAQSIRNAVERGLSLDSVAEVLSSPTIQALRERQSALRSQIADLSTTLLDGHPRIRSLRSQLGDVEREIAGEAANVQSSLETEADSARQREAALGAEVEQLKVQSARAGEEEVELRSLEREAQAQSQLLESYLTRYREAVARGSRDYLPVDARVFSQAQLPSEPIFPKVVPITAAAGLAGFLFAALGLLLSELFSGRALRATGDAPRRWPNVEESAVEPARPPALEAPVEALPVVADVPVPLPQSPAFGAGVEETGEAIVASGIVRVLMVSAGAEGRSGSVALARRLVGQSRSTILVDLSEGNAASRAMGVPLDAEGAGDLVDGTATFADVIHRDLLTSAHILPSGRFAAMAAEHEAAEEIAIVLDALAKAYDCIMIDCGTLPASTVRRLMDEDAALIVSAQAGEEAEAAATVLRFESAGLADIFTMRLGPSSDTENRRSEAA